MKLRKDDKVFLINKYIKEGLKKKQIIKRLREIDGFEDYIKFTNKYLKCKI